MNDLPREFSRIYRYQGRVHIQRFGATESVLRTGGGMSNLPLQRLSVPNKLHLDLPTGVLVPVLFKCLLLHVYDCRLFFPPARHGGCSAVVGFYHRVR